MLAKRQDHNRTDNSGVVLCLCRWPPRRRRSTQLAVYRRATASVTWIEYEVAWPSLACRCKTSASARTRHEAFTALLLLLWFERIVWRVTGRCLLPKEFLKIKPCLAWSSAENQPRHFGVQKASDAGACRTSARRLKRLLQISSILIFKILRFLYSTTIFPQVGYYLGNNAIVKTANLQVNQGDSPGQPKRSLRVATAVRYNYYVQSVEIRRNWIPVPNL